MIKPTRIFSFVFLLLFAFNSSVFAQKFGHINSQKFIAELPAAKEIDKELVKYRNKLIGATDQLQKALDEKAKKFQDDYTAGLFSKQVAEEKYKALEGEQQEIFKRRQEDEQKMLRSREDLYLPIFTQVEKAIEEIGKTQNFTFIFDSSYYNAILYVEVEDVSEAVKTQMALQNK